MRVVAFRSLQAQQFVMHQRALCNFGPRSGAQDVTNAVGACGGHRVSVPIVRDDQVDVTGAGLGGCPHEPRAGGRE